MIPADIQRKAKKVLERHLAGELKPRKLVGGLGLALEVGYRWRLLSRDKGQTWDLMSHEKYNKLTRGKKPPKMR